MRSRLYLIPTAVILFLLFFTVFGERGLFRIYELNREKLEIARRGEALRIENDNLKREIEALKSDRRYLESIARKDFGLVRPNETVYQFHSVSSSRKR
jgi:cell division protein FtsB